MAYPALLVTILFILWLLRRDVRRRPGLSRALWVPTFFLLILGSRPLPMWLAGGGYNGPRSSNNPIDQLFYAGVYGFGLVVASKRGMNWGKVLVGNWPLLLLYVYFICGASWSDEPLGSLVRILKDFSMIFVVAQIYSEKEPFQAMRAVFIRSACVLYPLSVTFNRWFPSFSREYNPNGGMMLSGVTGQKNSLGEILFLLCLFIFWDHLENYELNSRKKFLKSMPWDHMLLIGMSILLLVQSQSKTALICLSLGAAFIYRRGILSKRMASIVAYGAVLSTPFLLFFSREFADVIQPIVAALGRDMTFTGRTNIWDQITWETVNPWIGCGYWNFWQGPKGKAISDAIKWAIPTAHCGYLDVYLDGGILGVAALLLVLVAYGWKLIKDGQARYRVVGLAVLSTSIIYNLSESNFLRISPLWFGTVLMMVAFPLKKRFARTVSVGQEVSPTYLRGIHQDAECVPTR